MFTVFDLLQLLGLVGGAFLGGRTGYDHLGVLGGAGGAVAGGAVGFVLGGLPFFLGIQGLSWRLRRADSTVLGQRLVEDYFISHLILAELARRGEDLARYEEPLLQLMRSESSDRRRHGWISFRYFYPDRAEVLSDYNHEASTEECRRQMAKLLAPAQGDVA